VDVWLALEHSALGAAMRHSRVLYPLANVGHILAAMTFFAAVAMMDARLLGAFRQVPWRQVAGWCRPLAAAALAVQATTGLLLLAPEASAIVANPAFRLKLAMIALGLVNVAILEVLMRRGMRRSGNGGPQSPTSPTAVRICAVISLAAWLLTAALGRLIAYA
jgi:uncharacterized protein DUF6644